MRARTRQSLCHYAVVSRFDQWCNRCVPRARGRWALYDGEKARRFARLPESGRTSSSPRILLPFPVGKLHGPGVTRHGTDLMLVAARLPNWLPSDLLAGGCHCGTRSRRRLNCRLRRHIARSAGFGAPVASPQSETTTLAAAIASCQPTLNHPGGSHGHPRTNQRQME